jgi:hypothetical protein
MMMNGKIDQSDTHTVRPIAGSLLVASALFCLGVMGVNAQSINYQGKLTDKDGNPISGEKEVSLKVYEAKTDGKLTYEESIGTVTLTRGIYSFNFGEDGKSVATATETVGSTDGSAQIFNHTAANIPIVGNVKITAGDYSWSDTGGSSSSSQFTATANKETGQISAIFISGAPAVGTEITVSYDYNSTGIMGALSASSQSWLEITIGGETLSPRERLVAVPFALYAKELLDNKTSDSLLYQYSGVNANHNLEFAYIVKNGWSEVLSLHLFIPEGSKALRFKMHFHNPSTPIPNCRLRINKNIGVEGKTGSKTLDELSVNVGNNFGWQDLLVEVDSASFDPKGWTIVITDIWVYSKN